MSRFDRIVAALFPSTDIDDLRARFANYYGEFGEHVPDFHSGVCLKCGRSSVIDGARHLSDEALMNLAGWIYSGE